MFRVSILIHVVPAVFCIIITDPPLKPTDYKYSYDIYDPSTGDHKTQRESRLGDVVKGAYTVVDPDGNKRTVEYTADAEHGFKAVVLEEPTNTVIPANPAPIQEIQEPPNAYQNAYHKNAFYKQTASHRINLNLSPIPYTKPRHVADRVSYFSPANEIKPENEHFSTGNYFIPNKH